MGADDNPTNINGSSFFLELERAAKALTLGDSRADAARLRRLFEDLKRTGVNAAKTEGSAGNPSNR